jgi:hypothetical protein
MLNSQDYIDAFIKLQELCFTVTKIAARHIQPGVSEAALAEIYHSELACHNITEFWYPTLICAGEYTGQPLTRRNHLPSPDVRIRQNDIVILDTTPFSRTVWGNWSIVQTIGDDPFYHKLANDIFAVTIQIASEVLRGDYRSLGDIHSRCTAKAATYGLDSIDIRGNVGHDITQVPVGQTVDKTPLSERVFIDAANQPFAQPHLISIEPELARINPSDGIRYGGKFQFIVPFGYGAAGRQLIAMQRQFYSEMAIEQNNSAMQETLQLIPQASPARKRSAPKFKP